MASQGSSILTSHPVKGLWTAWTILSTLVRLPFWAIYFIPSFLRPNPNWTYRQALGVRILKTALQCMAETEIKIPTPLTPGKEGSRFVVMPPAASSRYVGKAAKDPEIRPGEVGGTWYPRKPAKGDNIEVVLHFHGGAYAIGDGRQDDAGFAAKTILSSTSATHVFAPQYRLASNPGGRFPAALQDAITSLLYLTENLAISPKNITVGGDSAGGNLTLSLLRYIADHPDVAPPSPVCAWLWSPWVDPAGSDKFDTSANISTDYLVRGFGVWGMRKLAPAPTSGVDLSDPYIRFLGTAFKSETPLFFSAGDSEVLFHDDVKCYEEFRDAGNKVEFQVEKNAVHDIILTGNIVGFQKEAQLAARRAGIFLESCKRA